MSKFSNILSSHTRERKINISALSAETGIERTLLHKYISGTRIPPDIKTVSFISDHLMLSPDEKKQLYESYRFTAMGEENYFRFKKISDIIDFLSALPAPDMFWNTSYSDSLAAAVVSDRLSVEITIKRIFQDSSTRNVFIASPPSYSTTANELVTLCLNRPDTQIQHVINFSKYDTPKLPCYNLNIFYEILPMIIFCSGYTPLINYCDPSEQSSSVSIFPNLILTDKYAFTFSNSCNRGILHTNHEILSVYSSLADEIRKKSYSVIHKKITSAPDETDGIFKINPNFYIGVSEKSTSLIFRTNDYFSKILLYEQSLKNIFAAYAEKSFGF